jgi:hypothetical protein
LVSELIADITHHIRVFNNAFHLKQAQKILGSKQRSSKIHQHKSPTNEKQSKETGDAIDV